jgi:hypothetical protein
MLDIIHTDNLIKTLAEEAIEVAYAAANRWTGLPSTHMFRFFFSYWAAFGSHRW